MHTVFALVGAMFFLGGLLSTFNGQPVGGEVMLTGAVFIFGAAMCHYLEEIRNLLREQRQDIRVDEQRMATARFRESKLPSQHNRRD